MFRKLISLVIVLVLSLNAVCLVAQAKTEQSGPINGYYELVVEETKDSKTVLISQDLPNGDAIFKLVKDGELIAMSTLNRTSNTVTSISYEEGNTVRSTKKIKPSKKNHYTTAKASYVTSGYIKYKWSNTSGTGYHYAKVQYLKTVNNSDQYNLNGKYKDAVSLAAYIAGAINVPGWISSKVALWVLYTCGFAAGVGPYIIPDRIVKATSTTMKWKLTGTDNSVTNYITDKQYVITQTGYSKKTYTGSSYYSTSAWTNRDSVFAIDVYNHLFGDNPFNVVAWTKSI